MAKTCLSGLPQLHIIYIYIDRAFGLHWGEATPLVAATAITV